MPLKAILKKAKLPLGFNSKSEALKLLLLFKEDKVNLLIDENNIVVAEAHKFYLLKKYNGLTTLKSQTSTKASKRTNVDDLHFRPVAENRLLGVCCGY